MTQESLNDAAVELDGAEAVPPPEKILCDACHKGHVKASAPEVKLITDPDTGERMHVTIKQGSGCLKCGGTMLIDAPAS